MSTQMTELTASTWTLIYSGPTDSSISVEKEDRTATIFLATGEREPDFQANGYCLRENRIVGVSLAAGENLYAWCTGQGKASCLIITGGCRGHEGSE
ncbi:hypothetical protein [Klebsiella aerogenes]|uniref:hypothetical protein n=1 Tax=Klebsiella aerogenes TaxID=548 RepID=UPI001F490E96|nr:hypothetical protein [Klebsiella aerogenes]